jgi:hypothetical protein
LSPVAIVISTLFWTMLWGPIGLLLATPLTVCLVVLGTHVKALEFIEVILGDEPALEPEEKFYQRLLAGDDTEAAEMAEKQLRKQRLATYYDAIPMRALALAQTDAAHGKLSHENQLDLCDTIEEVAEDLSEYEDTTSENHTHLEVDVPTANPKPHRQMARRLSRLVRCQPQPAGPGRLCHAGAVACQARAPRARAAVCGRFFGALG